MVEGGLQVIAVLGAGQVLAERVVKGKQAGPVAEPGERGVVAVWLGGSVIQGRVVPGRPVRSRTAVGRPAWGGTAWGGTAWGGTACCAVGLAIRAAVGGLVDSLDRGAVLLGRVLVLRPVADQRL